MSDLPPWTHEPWLPYLATEYMSHIPLECVFEWGMGGSTLFFAQRAKRVVSVEHNLDWFEEVQANLPAHPGLEQNYVPFQPGEVGSDKSNPDHYKSGSTELGLVNFRNYCSLIDSYGLFDLVLVDGMARASCLKHAISHVKPFGVLMLDNTDDNRSYYLEHTIGYFKDWARIDFFGYGPILAYPWKCTAFINKRKADYES